MSNVKQATSQELEKIQELMDKVKIAMLTTTEADGTLRARPMAIKTENFSGVLSFLTAVDTAKVDELKVKRQVNVTLSDPSSAIFASLSGEAVTTQNKTEIERLWDDTDQLWFPEGKDSDRIGVLSIRVNQAEYWDSNRLVSAFHMAKDYVKGEAYEGEGTEHQKLTI